VKSRHENILSKLIFKFHVAIIGLSEGLWTDSSLQIQFVFALFAMLIAWFLKFTQTEWIILLICIGLVISLEFMNSAFEQMLDRFDPTYHVLTKRAKDLGAAAVLVASIISLVIGIMLVSNHI
jgi:undecaprenol kinase